MIDEEVKRLRRRVADAVAAKWPEAIVSELQSLPGGVSSLTYRSTIERKDADPQGVVVKMAPPGLEPVRNRDVLRQAKILKLLKQEGSVAVPEVLFEDAALPPVFVMTLLEGESYEPLTEETENPPSPSEVDARARAAARMLATMHNVDLAGLGDLGEPTITLDSEVERWSTLIQTAEYGVAPRHEELYARLMARVPQPVKPAIVHGDYRLANILFSGTTLNAVIDWEIWAVGDPRTDLAWLLMHTAPAHRFCEKRSSADVLAGTGMPSLPDLLKEYLSVRATDTDDLDWFLAYSYYKTAAAMSVIVKRNRRRAHPDASLNVVADSLSEVIERGLEIVDCFESGTRWHR